MASIPRTRQTVKIRYDKVIYLLSKGRPYFDDIGNEVVPDIRRRVKAQRLELSNKDYVTAASAGLRWEMQFETYAKQYKGEKELEYQGDTYTIVRARNVDNDKGVRLVCESRVGNLAKTLSPSELSDERDVISD